MPSLDIFVKNVDGLVLPSQATTDDAGYDFVATSEPNIVGLSVEGGWSRIDYIEYQTNLYIAPQDKNPPNGQPVKFHTLIHPRSSISKYNLVLANSIGLVDNGYRNQILCRFKYIWQPEDLTVSSNKLVGVVNTDKIYKIGDKIGQLVARVNVSINFETVDDLNQTDRGTGGFGSTGV